MAAYATFDDVALAFEGTIPSTDRPRVEMLLRRASRRIDALVPSTATRLGLGELDPDLPAGLVIEAVLRVYRNPEGVTRDQMGPFNKEFNPKAVKAEISLDHDEVHELLDPLPDPPSSFRVGLPLRQQVLAQVRGFTTGDSQQTVTVSGAPTGGSFTLTLAHRTTAPLAYNATAVTVAAALNAAGADLFTVSVSGAAGGPWTVNFGDVEMATLPLLTPTATLTGGTSPTVTVTVPNLPTF
jgi:hypothetical protein